MQLSANGAYFIGLDIGTRIVSCVLVDLQMNVVSQLSIPTGSGFRDPEATFEKIARLPTQIVEMSGVPSTKVVGVGISIPGLVDYKGRIINAPFLEWVDFPMLSRFRPLVPSDWNVEVSNDADCFAAAECAIESGSDSETLLALLMSEGIGSALISGGVVYKGAHGFAGEIGHTIVKIGDRTATFEQLVGAGVFSSVFSSDCPVSEGVALLLASASEPKIQKLISDWAEGLATGLINAIHVLNPSRIVLGGPLADLYDNVSDKVESLVSQGLLHGFDLPSISVTKFRKDGAAIGAAALIREKLFELPNFEDNPAQAKA